MEESALAGGRDPREITISMMGPAILADSHKESSALIRQAAAARGQDIEELEARWNTSWVPSGPTTKAQEAFAAFEAVGVSKYYLQWFDVSDRTGIAKQVEMASKLTW
jgi:hypothetical protein